MAWNDDFEQLFQDAVARYHNNPTFNEAFFTKREIVSLASIGYKPQEMFDYVEDYAQAGLPSPSTVLLIAATRRDYFLFVQQGNIPVNQPLISENQLPSPADQIQGIPYLPRLIKKAQGKLCGRLSPDVMYCCSNDRKFFQEHGNIHPVDFLRIVWLAEGNEAPILEFVQDAMRENIF